MNARILSLVVVAGCTPITPVGETLEAERIDHRMESKLLSAGRDHVCMVHGDGLLYCWGRGGVGQTNSNSSKSPLQVTKLTDRVTKVGVGDMHTCVLTSGGDVQCFGSNYAGECGNGAPSSGVSTPATALHGAVDLAVGARHSCALLADGTVACWGRNDLRQLGDGTTTDRSSPVAVTVMTSLNQP